MKLSYWMGAKAIVEVFFGVGFVLVPTTIGTIFGMNLTPSGVLMAQVFGAAFICGSIILWLSRNAPRSEVALRAIVVAVIISNAIGFVVTLLGALSGAWNFLGWGPVSLYLVFGLGFTYFQFAKPTD
jgi:hypothetical protein